MAGNRCDHNPRALRIVDIAVRGEGGHPQAIGVISSYLKHAGTDRKKLPALATLNPSGRRKRTEAYEAVLAVCGFLTTRWLQLDTRRCAMPNMEYLQVPDAKHIALQISKTPTWQGKARMTARRVYDALENLTRAGYITKSRQVREQLEDGRWVGRPRIVTFTKKFFLDLGGEQLWKIIRNKGSAMMAYLRDHLAITQGLNAAKERMARYFNPGKLLSPRQAREWQQQRGRPPPWSPHREIRQQHLAAAKYGIPLDLPPAF